MENLAILPQTMVGLCILNGLRRGELFALRWRNFDGNQRLLSINEAVYEGIFDTPKTSASIRQLPLSDLSISLINDWKQLAKSTNPDSLIFSTRSGKPISPNNVLKR